MIYNEIELMEMASFYLSQHDKEFDIDFSYKHY